MSSEAVLAICGAIVALCSLGSGVLTIVTKRRVDDVQKDLGTLNVNVDGKLRELLDSKDRLMVEKALAALLQGRIEGRQETENVAAAAIVETARLAAIGAAATAAAAPVPVVVTNAEPVPVAVVEGKGGGA